MTPEEYSRQTKAIEQLRTRVSELVAVRSRSSVDRRAWERACEDFHRAFGEHFFPDGPSGWADFMVGGSQGFECAVIFLESDPYFFRSGYIQQEVWRRLKRAAIAAHQKRRLERVVVRYLSRPIRREFWDMVRYVRVQGSNALWADLGEMVVSEDKSLRTRARWLLLARQGSPVRDWVQTELIRQRYRSGYVPNLCFNDRIRGSYEP